MRPWPGQRIGRPDVSSGARSYEENSSGNVWTATVAAVTAGGGAVSITVITQGSNCSWTAVGNNAFLTIYRGASGSGAGGVAFTAA